MNNILKATNGNLNEQTQKLNDQIQKLMAQIKGLEQQLDILRREKLDEMNKAEKAKIQYEDKIKDLE